MDNGSVAASTITAAPAAPAAPAEGRKALPSASLISQGRAVISDKLSRQLAQRPSRDDLVRRHVIHSTPRCRWYRHCVLISLADCRMSWFAGAGHGQQLRT